MASRSWSLHIFLLLLSITISTVRAAFVPYTNCLASNIVDSKPRLLQFVPLNVTAIFNTTDSSHNLNITFYGNVTGQLTAGTYPASDDPSWQNPNSTFGKIVDLIPGASLYTTLFTKFNVLSYTPYSATPARFCDATINDECPLAPAFDGNRSVLSSLPAFTVADDLFSTYAFTTIAATVQVQSGDTGGQYYGCITAYITPDLGASLRGLLRYLPLAILIIVGVATVAAAMFSPWGSLDIFHWTSNFGRDEDVLRLVTPGFADCLQYIQFIVFSGSLSLNYPGFYQPVISRVGWSSLLFNESLVTGGNGTTSVVDGIYQYRNNSHQGLDRMTQLIGMTSASDAWADMMVWLVIILVSVAVLTQIGFLVRWIYRQVMTVPAEDLRSKNWYFTVGNVVRISVEFFLLPLVALSMYQFVVASISPTYAVALAALVLVAVICFTVWLVFLFVRTRPRSFLFDDLQTVLAYGPLYNTYCDDTATFALVPILVNFLRGIAIGAVQASGIAQVVLLAICEIIFILTINAFRPHPSATSMNIYHTCFAVIRLFTILLSITFVPSLNVGAASRGWVGYVILLIHACVLVFGFFLNAVQTLIEVVARLAGAGGSAGHDAARGGLVKVFGMRQLSRRTPRHAEQQRNSMASNAAMLAIQQEQKELQMSKTRSRSISASSTMLLDHAMKNPRRMSQNLDGISAGQSTPDAASTFTKRLSNRMSGSGSPEGIIGIQKPAEAKDPYYRPPRRNTMDALSSPNKTRGSFNSADWNRAAAAAASQDNEEVIDDGGEGSSTQAREHQDEAEDTINELTKTKTDYAVREVDFYYGVRGPALSSGTRKLKTGPADPTGPVSNATGWFRGLLGGKTKEKGKGFEVVRSAKAPPPGLFPPTEETKEIPTEPYHDASDDEHDTHRSQTSKISSPGRKMRDIEGESTYSDREPASLISLDKIASQAPSLPFIDSVGGIELPSRIGSEASKHVRRSRAAVAESNIPEVPALPRKSSRRNSTPSRDHTESPAIVATRGSLASENPVKPGDSDLTISSAGRIPFAHPIKNPKRHSVANSEASSMHHGHDHEYGLHSDQENQPPVTDRGYIEQVRSTNSALGMHAAPDLHEERPSSVGFVNQHRASDSIFQSPEQAATQGSVVEYGYSSSTPAWNGSAATNNNNNGSVGNQQRWSRFRD